MTVSDLFPLRHWLMFLFCYVVVSSLLLCYMLLRDCFNRLLALGVDTFDFFIWDFEQLEAEKRVHPARSRKFSNVNLRTK